MEQIVTSVITGLFLVVVTVLQVRTDRRVKQVRAEVSNDHTVNLRDDLDEKHDRSVEMFAAVVDKVDGVIGTLGTVVKDVGGIREDIRYLYRRSSKHDDQILEITTPRDEVRRIIERHSIDRERDTDQDAAPDPH